jgi:hypothetical protein
VLQHLITQDADLRMVPVDRNRLTAEVDGLRAKLEDPAVDPARRRVMARWVGSIPLPTP